MFNRNKTSFHRIQVYIFLLSAALSSTFLFSGCKDRALFQSKNYHLVISVTFCSLARLSVFVLSIMPVCPSDYYSLRQRTVWFVAVDRTVHCSRLYGPLPKTIVTVRTKRLNSPYDKT